MRRRILIVEGDTDNAEALRILLEFWGYRVEEARDREEAVACAQVKLPDAIILDMGMPTFADGCARVKQLRATPRRCGAHRGGHRLRQGE